MHVIRLVHPCRAVVFLRAGHHRVAGELTAEGAYYDGAAGAPAEPITHCPGCGEWLGTPFIAARTDWCPSPRATARCGR